jgi:hypothetical protein
MKHLLILILLLFLLSGSLFPVASPSSPEKNKKYPALYCGNIVVDGNPGEWPTTSFQTNKDAFLVFAVANDSANLYFCIKIKDEKQQMRVMRSGMDLWIDVKGKKKKETGICFPLSHTLPPGDNRSMASGGRPDPKKMRLMFLLQVKEMELKGFREGLNGMVNNKANRSGIMAVINWDSANSMVYEARIPFRSLNADITALDHVSVGMIMKALPKPQGQPGEGRQEGGIGMNDHEGTGGQRPPGGQPREGGSYGFDDRNQLFDDVAAWTEAGIAKK